MNIKAPEAYQYYKDHEFRESIARREKVIHARRTYKPEIHDALVVEVLSSGKSISSFCAKAGVGHSTFKSWLEAFPTFAAAFEEAEALYAAHWEELGSSRMIITPQSERVDDKMFKLNVLNRFGWRTTDANTLQVNHVNVETIDQAKAIAATNRANARAIQKELTRTVEDELKAENPDLPGVTYD